MNSRKPALLNTFVIVCAAFIGGLLTAAADEGQGVSSAGDGEEVDLGFEREANLTPAEQTAWADEKRETMIQTREYVGRLLAAARQGDRPDIVKINCLNNTMMEMNAQIGTFEDRQGALREAISMGDNDRRMHEYRVLVVVFRKVQSLRGEAEACIGEGAGFMGASTITVVPPEDKPEGDSTVIDVPEVFLDRPTHGSGYY